MLTGAFPFSAAESNASSTNSIATSFSDSFESSTLNPYWSVFEPQSGVVELTSTLAHSGEQSLRFHGGSTLGHTYIAESKGTVSVWFYDSGVYYSNTQINFYDGTKLHNALGYCFSFGILYDSFTYYSLNAQGLEYSNVYPRSQGWHQLTIVYGSENVQFLVDNCLVKSYQGDYSFDQVQLQGGDAYNEGIYFDDFQIQTTLPPTNILLQQDFQSLPVNSDPWQYFYRL